MITLGEMRGKNCRRGECERDAGDAGWPANPIEDLTENRGAHDAAPEVTGKIETARGAAVRGGGAADEASYGRLSQKCAHANKNHAQQHCRPIGQHKQRQTHASQRQRTPNRRPRAIAMNGPNPLKADIVSRHPRADRMVVILGNRGVRPCQTLTILLHQSAARLGTRARRSGLDLRCDLSTFGQFGPVCRSRGEYATWPCSILPSIASFGAAILWRSRSRISLRTVMRSTVQQCGKKRLVARSNSN